MSDRLDRRAALTTVAVLSLLLAACGPGGAASAPASQAAAPATAPPSAPTTVAPSDPPASPGASEPAGTPAPPAVVLDQPWATEPLVDVATGESFRIADLAGRPIIVETMAIWCSKCYAQQVAAYDGLAELGSSELVYLLVDVDPNESAEALAEYRSDNGFTGRYVVASSGLARALADEFGDQILNPPSTPLFTIATDGTVDLSPYGSPKSAEDIVALARSIGA